MALQPLFTLNPNIIDYEGIFFQLRDQLLTKSEWTEIITARGAGTITHLVSAVGAMNQLGFERAVQEVFPDTAIIPTSDYRIARMHGVPIKRNTPAAVTVRLSRDGGQPALEMPEYTQFLVGDLDFFNRASIIWAPNQIEAVVTLYQGSLRSQVVTSTGLGYQRFYVGPTGFAASNDDFFAIIDGLRWDMVTDGIYARSPVEQIFYGNALPDGRVDCWFGNGIFGAVPPAGQSIAFIYAETLGAQANNDDLGLAVSNTAFPGITGTTESSIANGEMYSPAAFYKLHAPHIYAAKRRAVTNEDFRALTLDYPGVIDAQILGQRDTRPDDLRWMNLLEAAVLTQTPWDATTFQIYANTMRLKSFDNLRMVQVVTEALTLDVSFDIYCFKQVDLTATKGLIAERVREFYAPQLGSLGAKYLHSDLHNLIVRSTPFNTIQQIFSEVESADDRLLVDYVQNLTPPDDIELDPHQYIGEVNVTINAYYTQRTPQS